ncbi:MAG: BatD family protein, partial [Polyangiaceae bacterium]
MSAWCPRGRARARWAISRALFGVLAALLFWPRTARAQGAPQVDVQADQDTIGVGDIVHVQMSATSADTMPSDARLGPSTGFILRGQNQSPTQTHMIMNGARSDRYTLVVDWALQAQRAGVFTVGPASFALGGSRFQARTLTLRVVPAGQAPVRQAPPAPMQSPFGFSPFDPWRSLFPGMNMGPEPAPQPQEPAVTIDPRLSLPAPLGSLYFLHATVDRTSAVVGEQVVFSVYEYIDVSASRLEVDDEDVRDAHAADFVKHALLKDDQDGILAGYAAVGGRTWAVKLVRRWALFPLRVGDLDIGPMSVKLVQPRAVAGALRKTEALRIHVTEPPMSGRPSGYAIGDVGRFTLAAEVSPRSVDQGGAVGVHV